VPSLITRDLIGSQRKAPRRANQLVQRTVLVQEQKLIPEINQPLYRRRNWEGVRSLPSCNHAVPQSVLGHRRKLRISYRGRREEVEVPQAQMFSRSSWCGVWSQAPHFFFCDADVVTYLS
jgi:hypothetical protein